jgi:hypothetical protein
MRQRLALIAVDQNDIACFGLLLAQLQAKAEALDLGGVLSTLQRVPRRQRNFFCAAPWTIANG